MVSKELTAFIGKKLEVMIRSLVTQYARHDLDLIDQCIDLCHSWSGHSIK